MDRVFGALLPNANVRAPRPHRPRALPHEVDQLPFFTTLLLYNIRIIWSSETALAQQGRERYADSSADLIQLLKNVRTNYEASSDVFKDRCRDNSKGRPSQIQ